MPLSYRNIINTGQLTDAITSGNLSNVFKSKTTSSAKYIKGYAQNSAVEALANSLNINKSLFKQAFGLEDKQLDAYDPYHTSDSKKEDFWFNDSETKIDGKSVQETYDEDTNTFKRGLYSQSSFRTSDFWYEDPFIPSFELFFDENSPFFDESNSNNSLYYFIQNYALIDPAGYGDREALWSEFKNIFFKIFEKDLKDNSNRNIKNKAYYITKIEGLDNLNHKFIKYGEDKITITINEDVSMIAWYLSELYNNIIYSYKNQRYMFPENLIRFDMTIKINEMRNYQMPQSNNTSAPNVPVNPDYSGKNIKNIISPKSQLVYTLHDCNFDFSESRNHSDSIEIGGYGISPQNTPQTLSFNIFYKSVTRYSTFPLIDNSYSISPWESTIPSVTPDEGSKHNYYDNLDRMQSQATPTQKGYLNQLLGKAAQTVVNQGVNYMDNLEGKLREIRGSAVNDLLLQFNRATSINKIEPDNVYEPDFNNRTSVKNLGKQIASGLLNDLTNTARDAANF